VLATPDQTHKLKREKDRKIEKNLLLTPPLSLSAGKPEQEVNINPSILSTNELKKTPFASQTEFQGPRSVSKEKRTLPKWTITKLFPWFSVNVAIFFLNI